MKLNSSPVLANLGRKLSHFPFAASHIPQSVDQGSILHIKLHFIELIIKNISPPQKKIENLFISIYTIYYIQTKVHLKIIKEEKVPTKRVSISGETLCYDNRRLIGTPLIVIARQSQKNRD